MTDELIAIERRITLRLLAYWEKMRGERMMPVEADIDPHDIQDLWDNCFIVRIKSKETFDYKYHYLGKAIADTGLFEGYTDGMIAPSSGVFAKACARVATSGKPLLEDGQFINDRGQTIKYRQCLLPLGNGDVEAIFGGLRFRGFPK